jgi:hypothetical protein
MTDREKLVALVEAFSRLCRMFCKDPMKTKAYRDAVQ